MMKCQFIYQRLIQDQFILPGAADESELFLVIKSGEMPPKKQNNFLSEEEVENYKTMD